MTPWSWWAGAIGDPIYDLACDCPTRDDAIRQASLELSPGEQFQIIEARASEAMEHEGTECVPFLRTRNHEVLTAGPTLLFETDAPTEGVGETPHPTKPTDTQTAGGEQT